METIYKYTLETISLIQTIDMPPHAEILSVANQRGDICMWVRCLPSAKSVPRRFRVVGTGHPLYQADDTRNLFIGTVLVEPFVWHVFEVA